MLSALIKKSIRQFIYCHHHSPGLQTHLSTRWTGQTHLTNSQGAIHESWMARCSPRALGFSREQYAFSHLSHCATSLHSHTFPTIATPLHSHTFPTLPTHHSLTFPSSPPPQRLVDTSNIVTILYQVDRANTCD